MQKSPLFLRFAAALLILHFVLAPGSHTLADENDTAREKNMRLNGVSSIGHFHGPLVIAHRGDSAAYPENTLPAFASAVKAGADLVELDFYRSADDVLVVFHDKTLKRTTNALQLLGGDAPIGDLSLAAIKKLDAGAWKNARFRGTRIPTLAEALQTIQAGAITLIEHKQGSAAACIALLREKKLLQNVVVQSFDWRFLADCHKLEPQLVLGALGGKELTAKHLDDIQTAGASVVGWRHSDISPREIQQIHERGLQAWVFTVNDPLRAVELARAGIDGVISDKPALMLQTLAPFRQGGQGDKK